MRWNRTQNRLLSLWFAALGLNVAFSSSWPLLLAATLALAISLIIHFIRPYGAIERYIRETYLGFGLLMLGIGAGILPDAAYTWFGSPAWGRELVLISGLIGVVILIAFTLWWKPSRIGTEAIARAFEELHSADSDLRFQAIAILRDTHDPQVLEPLIAAAVADRDLKVRGIATGALGFLGDKRAVHPLLQLLADADSNIRAQSARALGRLGDASAIPALEQIRRSDASRDVQEVAKRAVFAIRKQQQADD